MKEKEINLLGIKKKVIICHIDSLKGYYPIIMEAITEKKESEIDASEANLGEISYLNEDKIRIPAKDIYLYGEVNLNADEDINLIKKFNLINDNDNWIPSNFNYHKGISVTTEGVQKRFTTWDKIKWFKYNYCLLGKPKRIIIYKSNKASKLYGKR